MKQKIFILTILVILLPTINGCAKKTAEIELLPLAEQSMAAEQTMTAAEAGAWEQAAAAASANDEIAAADNSGVTQEDNWSSDRLGQDEEPVTPACFVHICGAVNEPGVYELSPDSRLFEAVAMAGGFADNADTELVNLALPVIDGSRIQIPTQAEAASWKAAGGADWPWGGPMTGDGQRLAGTNAAAGLVNINTASPEVLATLPGIGTAKAQSIVAYREAGGRFDRIEDIMLVEGIKEGLFNKIKDRIMI